MTRKKQKPTSFVRLIVYGVLFSAFLLGLEVHWISNKKQELLFLENKIENALFLAHKQKAKASINQRWHQSGALPTKGYLQREVCGQHFLQKEKKELREHIASNAFFGNKELESRFAAIANEQNRLLFKEDSIETTPFLQESLYTQKNPIEVDNDDLVTLLTAIEGGGLLIPDFSMKRKSVANDREVFQVNMQLIKREKLSS